MIASLPGTEQAVALAAVTARTGLDPWDAHVAAVADPAICPILTLDAGKRRQPPAGLDEPVRHPGRVSRLLVDHPRPAH